MFKVNASDISESLWLRYSSPRLTLAIDYFLVKENIIIKDISNTPQNDNNSLRGFITPMKNFLSGKRTTLAISKG
jgi:hypothetical protein